MHTTTPHRATRLAVLGAAAALAMTLTACSSGDDGGSAGKPPGPPSLGDPAPDGLDELDDLDLDDLDLDELGDLLDELGDYADDVTYRAGDCWGRPSAVDHDPRPCSEPHVFEVVGVFEDVDLSEYEDIRARGDAKDELCEGAFADYFSFPVHGQQAPIISVTPEPVMMNFTDVETVVCSAYTTRSEEHTASFR